MFLSSLSSESEKENKFLAQNSFVKGRCCSFCHDHRGSISPTFYTQLLRQQFCASKVQTYIVSTKKLCAQLTCIKAARRTLVKLTPGFVHKKMCKKISFKENLPFFQGSDSQPGCHGTQGCRQVVSRVPPNIDLTSGGNNAYSNNPDSNNIDSIFTCQQSQRQQSRL